MLSQYFLPKQLCPLQRGVLSRECPLREGPLHNALWLPCFAGFYPYFRVYDAALGTSWQYEGKYTLLVIGGTPHKIDSIQSFTEDEINLYNNKD